MGWWVTHEYVKQLSGWLLVSNRRKEQLVPIERVKSQMRKALCGAGDFACLIGVMSVGDHNTGTTPQKVYDTVDGRNPKQPPGMVKTL